MGKRGDGGTDRDVAWGVFRDESTQMEVNEPRLTMRKIAFFEDWRTEEDGGGVVAELN